MILELAKSAEFNEKSEAQAIMDYVDFLQILNESDLLPERKAEIRAEIEEIISDELNHQQKLKEIFTSLTGIMPNKDQEGLCFTTQKKTKYVQKSIAKNVQVLTKKQRRVKVLAKYASNTTR